MARTAAHSPAPAGRDALTRLAAPALRMFPAADRSDVLVSLIGFTEGTILAILR
jgi:hypothetical protein